MFTACFASQPRSLSGPYCEILLNANADSSIHKQSSEASTTIKLISKPSHRVSPMFAPIYSDPWTGNAYVRLPRSGLFPTSAYEEPFIAYSPFPDAHTGAELQCNCRSCAVARSAAAADEFGARHHVLGRYQQPIHPLRLQQFNHHRQPPLTPSHSPHALSFKRTTVPPYSDDEDEDDVFQARFGCASDQVTRQQQPVYDPLVHHSYTTAGRPSDPYAMHKPAVASGRGLHTVPTVAKPNCPYTAFATEAAAHPFQAAAVDNEQQYQATKRTAQQLPRSRSTQQIKVQLPNCPQAAAQRVQVQHSTARHASKQQQQQQKQQQQQQQQRKVLSKPAFKFSRSEAATIIQSWWRMRRLARQQPAIKSLAAAAAQLHSTRAKFEQYKMDSSSGATSSGVRPSTAHLSHKQYLELNELAMRVLLQLDATICGVPELRAVRKRLTAAAISLLDEIQGAYSAAVHCSMEVSDDVVLQALHNIQKTAAADDSDNRLEPAEVESQTAVMTSEQQKIGVRHDEKVGNAIELNEVAQQQQQQQQQGGGDRLLRSAEEDVMPSHSDNAGDQSVVHLSSEMRVVLIYPGSQSDAATQTDL